MVTDVATTPRTEPETRGGSWGECRPLDGLTDSEVAEQLRIAYRMRAPWRARGPGLLQREASILREVLATGAESVLEIGCGEKHLVRAALAAGLTVRGCDPIASPSMGPEIWVEPMLAEVALTETPRNFDVALAVNVLQQTREPSAVVRMMARVAKRAVIVAVPVGWSEDALDAWCWRTHQEVIRDLGLDGPFSDVDIQRLRAGPGEAGDVFLAVGKVRR